jgi:hypothetical protein
LISLSLIIANVNTKYQFLSHRLSWLYVFVVS